MYIVLAPPYDEQKKINVIQTILSASYIVYFVLYIVILYIYLSCYTKGKQFRKGKTIVFIKFLFQAGWYKILICLFYFI